MGTEPVQQYVLMPARGTRASGPNSTIARAFLAAHAEAGPVTLMSRRPRGAAALRVVDSIHEDGVKLIEGTARAVMALRG
jgi:hypothetical protein